MKTKASDAFQNLSTLIREYNLIFEDSFLSGSVVATQPLKDNLLNLEEHADHLMTIEAERASGNPNGVARLKIGETFNLKIGLLRNTGNFFGKNLSDLLSASGGHYCTTKPNTFYLTEDNYGSWDSQAPDHIRAYLMLLEFVNYLKSDIADAYEKKEVTLIRSASKLRIPISYDAKIIQENSPKIIKSLEFIHKYLGSSDRREDKNLHLKLTLIKQLSNQSDCNCFSFLLANIDRISDSFAHSYEVFISNYSFENDYEDILRENRGFIEQLNKAVQSVQGRAIAIPFGTILPALLIRAEITEKAGLELVFLIASTFICLVIALMICAQFIDLFRIKQEYQAKSKRMEIEIPTLHAKLKADYRSLTQYHALNFSLLVVVALGLIAAYMFPLAIYFQWDFEWVGSINTFIASIKNWFLEIPFTFSNQ